jgi:hypothetical protein
MTLIQHGSHVVSSLGRGRIYDLVLVPLGLQGRLKITSNPGDRRRPTHPGQHHRQI